MGDRHTRRQALRILRRLNLPREARKVLGHPRYWDVTFCEVYFERCRTETFRHPHSGLQLALVGITLAERLELSLSGTLAERDALKLRASYTLGSAYRAIGDLVESERTYAQAETFVQASPKLPTREIAIYWRRLAILRADQRRFDEAVTLTSRALTVHTKAEHRKDIGITYVLRGAVHLEAGSYDEAARDSAFGLAYVDHKTAEPTYLAGLANLSRAIGLRICSPTAIQQALVAVVAAYRSLRLPASSLPKLKLRWVEGQLASRLGSTRFGERRLRRARAGIIKLGLPYETAMVSLDLAEILLESHEVEAVAELAAETLELCNAMGIERDTLAALSLFEQATADRSRLSAELLRQVRQKLEPAT